MYNVFNTVPTVVGTTFNYQGLSYVRSQIEKNVSRAIDYYRSNYFRVSSDHLLCRIILSLDSDPEVNVNMSVTAYRDAIETAASGMHTIHHLNSDIIRSRPSYKGDFFGEGNVEVYISDDTPVDLSVLEDDWRELSPITVVSHYRSDLLPIRLGMSFKSNERGLSVIKINVVELMLQYRMWRMSFESIDKGMEQFIGSYPLVNAIRSTTDVAVFNRFYNTLLGLPMGDPDTNVPFITLNNERRLDDIIKVVQGKIVTTMMSPEAILMSIPTIFAPSAFHLQMVDDSRVTDQNTWAIVAGKLKYVGFVLEYLERLKYGDARGTKIRLTLRREVNRLIGNKRLRNGVDRHVSDYMMDYIYEHIVVNL